MTQRPLHRHNAIVEDHLQLVPPIAHRYASRTGENLDDLIQVGRLGLIRASRQFKSHRATPFIAFARPHIRGAILHYLRDSAGLIRLPRGVEERAQRLTRCPETDLTPLDHQILSLYRSKGRWTCLHEDSLAATTNDLQAMELQGDRRRLRDAMNKLPKQEKVAIKVVILEGLSLRQAGGQLKVSAMTVQRRVKSGLTRLAGWLEPDQLAP